MEESRFGKDTTVAFNGLQICVPVEVGGISAGLKRCIDLTLHPSDPMSRPVHQHTYHINA